MPTHPVSARDDSPVLIHNAKIYCFDEHDTKADSILIHAGRVVAVGRHDELAGVAGAATTTMNFHGTTVLPGLIDTHPHLLHFAARQPPLVDISDATSHNEIVERIAAKAQTRAAGDWIMTTPVGEAWYFIRRSYKDLFEGELPTRHTLDRATSRHPVVILAWEPNIPNTAAFSSLALAKLGITRDLPNRVSGVIIEKDEHGEPTGRLHGAVNGVFSNDEFAYELWRKLPAADFDQVLPATRRAISTHHRLGVTGIFENHFMQRR
jgi:predicted amidohydrolase YtcJ